MAEKTCCGSSVGVLITDDSDRLLMVRRGWWPLGTAPVAGHVYDAHSDAAEAVVAEVREEVGLSVTGEPRLLWEGHQPNLCASLPATPPGHYWWLYRAQAAGELRPAEGETNGADWHEPAQVEQMARATIEFAKSGAPVCEQPADSLEAVWVPHLALTGHLTVPLDELLAVARLYTTPPPVYWRGGRPTG